MDRKERDLHSRGVENSVEGKGKDIKGRVKDAVGGLTGDQEMQAEGKLDRVEGKIQDEVGELQRDIDRKDRKTRNDRI